jgi:hypothetical protein
MQHLGIWGAIHAILHANFKAFKIIRNSKFRRQKDNFEISKSKFRFRFGTLSSVWQLTNEYAIFHKKVNERMNFKY